MNQIKRAISVAGTGISFVIFMIWGFLLGALLFPILRFIEGKRARAAFHRHMRFTWQVFTGIMQLTGAFRSIRVSGLENLPKDRPYLLIGNHLTLVDIVVLGARVPNFNCVVKTSLWNHPFFGSVVKACNFIPNMASDAFIDQCQSGFDENRPLIIFPQGSRTPLKEPLKFQRGAAQVAVRTGVDVYPALVNCQPVTLAKGMPWYRVPAFPRLHIEIQPALLPPDDFDDTAPTPRQVRQINRWWEEYFRQQLTNRLP